jgi:FkbM family methyltransferase
MTLWVPQTSPEFPPCGEVPLTPAARRKIWMAGIDVLIDAGANEGQYASWFRSLGFKGRIISFEPATAAFEILSRAAARDERWECHNLALGAEDSELQLHIARDSTMTSAFRPTEQILRVFPDAAETGTERAPMRSLESLWPSLGCAGQRVYLKVDVEGFELAVLQGAGSVLDAISWVELELSLAPSFGDAPLIQEVLTFVAGRGFSVFAFELNHGDDYATGQMLVIDGVFRRVPADGAPAGPA